MPPVRVSSKQGILRFGRLFLSLLTPEWGIRSFAGLTLAPDLSDPPTRERHLLRLYVTYRVLTRHGFSPQRVIECLEALKKEGYEAGGKDPLAKITWEEGMAWVSWRSIIFRFEVL